MNLGTQSASDTAGGPARPGRFAGYSPAAHDESVRANRSFWDSDAENYLTEHGGDLGEKSFQWCPEGLQEKDVNLLGIDYHDSSSQVKALEVGAGAGQCARWLNHMGVNAIASDLSIAMLQAGAKMNTRHAIETSLVQCDGAVLPFADASFDVAFTAYGVFPFVPDITSVLREMARVVNPGGRIVFSVTHPVRWAFPDDPSDRGLTVTRSYFDTNPYIETDNHGSLRYAEHHRTLGDYVRAITAANLSLIDVVEPTWPSDRETVWGGWSKTRGEKIPGTAIFVCDVPHACEDSSRDTHVQTYKATTT